MHWYKVIRINLLERCHRLGHDLLWRRRQMPAADHRVDLVNPRGFLDLADGINDPSMPARGDDHQTTILDVVGGRVLAPENVRYELTGLCLHLQRPRWEVERGLTARTRWASLQTRRRRGLLKIDETWDMAGGESVACHHGGLLGQHHLETLRFEFRAIELSTVALLTVWRHHPAVAEGILASGVQGQTGWHLPMQDTHQVREGTVVVGVPVTNDQGVGLGRVDFEHLVVVGETLPGPGEVEQDLLTFVPTDRGQMV